MGIQIKVDDEITGPFEVTEIQEMIDQGSAKPMDQAREEGKRKWAPLQVLVLWARVLVQRGATTMAIVFWIYCDIWDIIFNKSCKEYFTSPIEYTSKVFEVHSHVVFSCM